MFAEPEEVEKAAVKRREPDFLDSERHRNRAKRACTKCQLRKTRCSGEKPCQYCLLTSKPNECVYLEKKKPKVITVRELYVDLLKRRIRQLEQDAQKLQKEADLDRRMPLANIANGTFQTSPAASTRETDAGVEAYVLEKELSVYNLLVETNVRYIANHQIFLGNSNCTKFNLTVQNILTDKLNLAIQDHNYQYGLLSPALPPPGLATVFFKLRKLHWNLSSLVGVEFPEKLTLVSVIGRAFEFVGEDCLVVNVQETFLLVDRVYDPSNEHSIHNLANFSDAGQTHPDFKLEIIQLLILMALGEVLILNRELVSGENKIPGYKYFLQATELFEDIFEEVSLVYIETILLFAMYSLVLNRKDSAYVYTGIGIRLAYTMGLNRKSQPEEPLNEKRKRIWWACYVLDKLVTIRLGHPVMVQDASMDVDLPQHTPNSGFPDPRYFVAHIKLAKITGTILNQIYSIRKSHKPGESFIVCVHDILKLLRDWHDRLDVQDNMHKSLTNQKSLKLDYLVLGIASKRHTFSLHLSYNYCIILTTRPLLLYVFKDILDSKSENQHSPTILGIVRACINAASVNMKILSLLWVKGSYELFGLLDNNYLFGALVVLLLVNFIRNFSDQKDNLIAKIFHNSSDPLVKALSQDELVVKIKFGIALFKKGSFLGSVTSKLYDLQLISLVNLLEKLSYIKDAKSKEDIKIRLDSITTDRDQLIKTAEANLVSTDSMPSNHNHNLFEKDILFESLDDNGWKVVGKQNGVVSAQNQESGVIDIESAEENLLDFENPDYEFNGHETPKGQSFKNDIDFFNDIMNIFALPDIPKEAL